MKLNPNERLLGIQCILPKQVVCNVVSNEYLLNLNSMIGSRKFPKKSLTLNSPKKPKRDLKALRRTLVNTTATEQT